MTILGFTCQRDDGPFLVEWLAHHLAAGFDRMLVLSHDCRDGSDILLPALSQDDRIEYLPFTPKGKKAVQWQALKRASEHSHYATSDWALFFDCDEFLCLTQGTLPEFIVQLETDFGRFDALALPWLFFGSAGQAQRGEEMTPERFTKAAPEGLHFPLAHLFKSLHRPEAFQRPGIHRPRGKPSKPAQWLGPDGRPLTRQVAGNDAAISLYGQPQGPRKAWLNHYALRSREEFLVKRLRGRPNHSDQDMGVTYWAERNWNSVEDTRILPMMAKTRETYAELMALPGVAEAHAASLTWHRAAYDNLRQDMETLRLEFRLGLLTGSSEPSFQELMAYLAQRSANLAREAD